MLRVFDTVLTSSDLSLDRVLGSDLPVAMVFYENELPDGLRQKMGELASLYAGKVLIVSLSRADAPQAASRFGVRQFPTLVAVRDGKPVTTEEGARAEDLKLYIAHLLGEGARPAPRTTKPPRTDSRSSAGQGPISVSELDFDREVLRADRPVLVDFWAPWCAPCRMVAPALEALARDQAKTLKVVKVNVDKNPGLASRYRAMSIPTMIVFKGGREVDRWVGAQPENVIRSRIARWI